jgi:hypothetical protein
MYEVRVHGIVSGRVLDSNDAPTEIRADTLLHGHLPDQAALHGLFARISDLGLELIDLHRIRSDTTPDQY